MDLGSDLPIIGAVIFIVVSLGLLYALRPKQEPSLSFFPGQHFTEADDVEAVKDETGQLSTDEIRLAAEAAASKLAEVEKAMETGPKPSGRRAMKPVAKKARKKK